MFHAPREGWIAWVADEDAALVWSGSAWTALTTGSGGGDVAFSTVGINDTADTTNRLVVASDATLFSHDGDDHRLKINKAAAADTASLLYQTAFSGRAELGLAGDDDFHFKVSADGSTWNQAIIIDRSTGGVSFPNTTISGGRELLTANRTYYVRTDGSNSNNGLANTSGGAFLTIQKAYDVITSTLDLGGKTATMQVGSGTFTAGLSVTQPWTGGGAVVLQGDTSTPANVIISTTGASCVATTVPLPGALTVQGFELRTTSGGSGIDNSGGGVIIAGVMRYGACANAHMQVASGCYIGVVSNYTISGNASQHWNALHGGFIQCDGKTITLSGTPAFSSAFAMGTNTGKIEAIGNTFSGSATGTRYSVTANAVINTNGGGASAFPGNASGGTGTGGQYT
jgi:hypothetical protein